MPLWGNSDAVEAKPKHLSDAEKLNTYATEKGWVKKITGTGGRAGRLQEEVLVAIGNLSTSLNLADITAIDWNIDSFDKSDGGTNGNEGSGSGRGPHALAYASGSGTNRLTFELAIAAANAATNASDVLSIAANCLALNSGTINEKSTETFVLEEGTNDGSADEFIELEGATAGRLTQEANTASTITSATALGTAAGTITVAA